MKFWIDDCRPAPEGYIHACSVERAKELILIAEILDSMVSHLNNSNWQIEVIDIDHDAGEYYKYGGDYIELLNWLEGTKRNYPIRIHSMNPVGIQNMRVIIQRNGWTEIK
jgi:hypothetical protein